MPLRLLVSALALWLLGTAPALAACLGAVAKYRAPPLLQHAGYQLAQTRAPEAVTITFVGHATFLIESPAGAKAATDYNDYIRPRVLPDIVTMNRAHTTHFTDSPEAGIRHVLRGWPFEGRPARHNVVVRDMRVRNVPTNIRDWGGGTQYDANSIFIFDTADLCIAHLGHLHHPLTPGHLTDIGKVDVVMVPVDGGFTLNQFQMSEVVAQLKAPLVLPMHYFSEGTLERFLGLLRESHEIVLNESQSIVVSRQTLPRKPRVVVLPGPH